MKNYDNTWSCVDDALNIPNWRNDGLEVEFTFRNGMKKTVSIDTAGMGETDIGKARNALLGKIKLIQSMFEHGTHGQITVQGVTVRADDLITVRVR